MKKINTSQICSVTVFINSRCLHYTYKESRKFLFFTLTKEGYYYLFDLGGPTYVTVESIEKSGELICRDKKVFYKPHLEMKMSDGSVYEKFFETEDELRSFLNTDTMKGIKWVEV